ncbi:hypothetical protein NDN01_13880 [Sphingomonas sp. QA11]|uniref:hypothetical protein n=1 Tax=Sphingomonas sp. QA11 TaxID=2950605 RepID=UPI00234B9AB3|nr:hypothetical protein [Sphingomonas sp. QA11]WCM25163.1 hypothetical protein NDN01_13880 [Sphingomonas sp. QA11]
MIGLLGEDCMMLRKVIMASMAIALVGLSGSPGYAGQATGRIATIGNSGGSNYAFRVFLDSGFPGFTNNMAFINASDDNYQTRVATLLTLYSLGKTVQIITIPVAGGFCQIGDITSQ